MLELWVDKQLKFIASEELLTLCAEVQAEAAPARCRDYSICLEDETSNPTAGHAVEMPSYGHAFHRKVHHQVVRPEIHLPAVLTRFVYVS